MSLDLINGYSCHRIDRGQSNRRRDARSHIRRRTYVDVFSRGFDGSLTAGLLQSCEAA